MRKPDRGPTQREIGRLMISCHVISRKLFFLSDKVWGTSTLDPTDLLPQLVKDRVITDALAKEVAELFVEMRHYTNGFHMEDLDIRYYTEMVGQIKYDLTRATPRTRLRLASRNEHLQNESASPHHASLTPVPMTRS